MASPARRAQWIRRQSGQEPSTVDEQRVGQLNLVVEAQAQHRREQDAEPYVVHHARQVPKRSSQG